MMRFNKLSSTLNGIDISDPTVSSLETKLIEMFWGDWADNLNKLFISSLDS